MVDKEFDIIKFGFTLSDDGVLKRYDKKSKGCTVSLRMLHDRVSLYVFLSSGTRITVARQYLVETQEQLDFLILNGSADWLFKDNK